MGDNPALIVRVVANIDELKKGLTEGKVYIETTAAEMQKLSGAAADAGAQIETVGAAAASEAIQAMPSHFAAARAGLNDVAEGAGLTVTQLGLFATAGLVAGTAMASWKITRAAMEFLELDGAVAKTWTRLLGFGDATAAAAGAKLDVLTRASTIAGRAITDMAEAIAINDQHFKDWDDALNRAQGPAKSAAEIREWRADLQKVVDAGVFPALVADINSHSFSLKELSDRYRVHIGALQLFEHEQKAASDAEKEAAAIETQAAAAAAHWADVMTNLTEVGVGWKGTLDTIDGAVVEGIKFYLQAGVAQGVLAEAYGLTAAQVRSVASELKDETATQTAATEADKKATDARAKWAKVQAEVASATMEFGSTLDSVDGSIVDWAEHLLDSGVSAKTVAEYYGLTDAQVRALQSDLRAGADAWQAEQQNLSDTADQVQSLAGEWISAADAKKNFDKGNSLDIGHAARDPEIMDLLHAGWSLENAEALKFARQWGFQASTFSPKGNPETAPDPSERVPGYATGVLNAPGGWSTVGERGPERMYVPQGASIYPTGSGAGGTIVVNNTFHVNGTGADVARVAIDALTKQLQQIRLLPAR